MICNYGLPSVGIIMYFCAETGFSAAVTHSLFKVTVLVAPGGSQWHQLLKFDSRAACRCAMTE